MELTWIAYSKNPQAVVFNFLDEFMRFSVEDGADFSKIDQSVESAQFDKDGNSFVQRLNEEGIPEDQKIKSLSEIPGIEIFQKMFNQLLKDREVSPPTKEDLLNELRELRDVKLQKADIQILRYLEQGLSAPSEWIAYKQALRDIPSEIETGKIPAPTAEKETDNIYVDDYQFIFNYWPIEP